MSFFSMNNLAYEKDILNKSYYVEEDNLLNPLDNSFSLIISDENKNKNSLDLFESQSQIINNSKNSDIDKECSPAPAPLRSSQSQIQNDLAMSHNMECPEVVQQSENKTNDIINIFNEEGKCTLEEELIEKPYDQSLYFFTCQPNLENSNNGDYIYNFESGDKSAAVNAVPNNESLNSLFNRVNNLDMNNNNCNNNLDNFNQDIKNNLIPAATPLCSKNNKYNKKGNVLFLNVKKDKKNITKSTIYRKLKPDSLRKKIKARLHKKLRQIINSKLKEAGSKFYLDMLPQSFITNINIGFNKPLLNITMRELFKMNFGFKAKDREKIEYNIRILKYIEDNPDINNNPLVRDFLDCKYSQIIKKYMEGKYLLDDIERLKSEGEEEDYINRYTFIALHWIEFYENGYI